MSCIPPASLLRAWERAASVIAPLRGLAILEAVDGIAAPDQSAPLACVDAALAEHRCAWFGPLVRVAATCPECRAEYEMQIDLSAIQWPGPAGPIAIVHDGCTVEVRPPCIADLVALANVSQPETFAAALFARCVVQPVELHDGTWPETLRDAASEMLDRAGYAPRTIDVGCGQCGAAWRPLIDIAGILWTEIDTGARRLLHEVHRLAAAFHWTEGDILALSPARRNYYLAAIG